MQSLAARETAPKDEIPLPVIVPPGKCAHPGSGWICSCMVALTVKSAASMPETGASVAMPAVIEAIERFISVVRAAFNLNSFNNY
jgi:hypothetical protein